MTTWAARRCAFGATALVTAGLWFGRPDVVGLATPFVVALVLTARGRRSARATTSLSVGATRVREGDEFDVAATVGVTETVPLLTATLALPPALHMVGPSTHVMSVVGGEPVEARWRVRARWWGRWDVGPVTVKALDVGYLTESTSPDSVADGIRVLPVTAPFSGDQAVPSALAYAGAHRSRLAGPGVEFAGIRRYESGDSLRRINWRATSRSRSLQVTTTHTDRSAAVAVLIDTANNAGPRGTTILDRSVRAAAAIAEHYLGLGDSVRLLEYGGQNRAIAPGSGRFQLARVQEALLDVGTKSAAAAYAGGWLARQHIDASLAVVVTPLLDKDAAANLVVLRRQAPAMVVVDTLSDQALPPTTDAIGELALRAWRLERQALVARLSDLGIPTVRWRGPGTLDAVLRQLAGMARAPRAALR